MSGRYLNETGHHPCREFLGRNLRKTLGPREILVPGETIAEIGISVSKPEGLGFCDDERHSHKKRWEAGVVTFPMREDELTPL